MKKVQIDEAVYLDLISYFLDEIPEDEATDAFFRIQAALKVKEEARQAREAYTRYKTAETTEGREEGRQQYLEAKGVPGAFRWTEDYERKR